MLQYYWVMRHIFPKENKIRDIGGRLEDDYVGFRQVIIFINDNFIRFFYLLGYKKATDVGEIIDILSAPQPLWETTREKWIERVIGNIKSGKVKAEKYISPRMLQIISEAPDEEKEKLRVRELYRNLKMQYRKIYNYYMEEFKPSASSYFKIPLQIFREAIFYNDYGLAIEVDKFLEIYASHIEAEESETRKLHQAAAEAINRFFSGALSITQEELDRYFILENGIVKPKPTSITREEYMRLGYRGNIKRVKVK